SGREGTAFFGVPANPSGTQFKSAAPDQGVTTKSAWEQLVSLFKSSEVARNDPTREEAKQDAGCATATNPCVKGDPAPSFVLKGVPGGSERLSPEILKAMLGTENGRRIIEAERKARAEEASAKSELDAIEKTSGEKSADPEALAVRRAAV